MQIVYSGLPELRRPVLSTGRFCFATSSFLHLHIFVLIFILIFYLGITITFLPSISNLTLSVSSNT